MVTKPPELTFSACVDPPQENAMQDPTDSRNDGKLDLVPMIDCVMLLLLFLGLPASVWVK